MKYMTLKGHVEKHGGHRLAMSRRMRDALVDIIVSDWPADCSNDHLHEVVAARVLMRIRARHNRMTAALIGVVLVGPLVKCVVDWYLASPAHRVLMVGWARKAA